MHTLTSDPALKQNPDDAMRLSLALSFNLFIGEIDVTEMEHFYYTLKKIYRP